MRGKNVKKPEEMQIVFSGKLEVSLIFYQLDKIQKCIGVKIKAWTFLIF